MKKSKPAPIICPGCTHVELQDYNFHKMQCCTLTGKPEYKSQCIDYRPKSMLEEKQNEINR